MHPSRIFSILMIVFLLITAILTVNIFYFQHLLILVIGPAALAAAVWRIKYLRFLFLFIAITAFSMIIVLISTPGNNAGWWGYYSGKTVNQPFIINTEPVITGRTQSFLVKSYDQKIKGNVRVSTNQIPKYNFGDIIRINGELKGINSQTSFGYNKSQQIVANFNYPEINRVPLKYQNRMDQFYYPVRSSLIGVKNSYVTKIGQIIPEPEAGLLSGIIFGTKAELSTLVISILSVTGTIHIIALSGYNITIVADGSKYLTGRMGRNMAFWVPTLGIIIFLLATGLSSSVIRAAIMGIMLLLAARLGRQPDAVNSVLFASVMMVIFNPFIILYDIGFQLSFAAVTGIIFLAPQIGRYFSFLGKKLGPIMAGTVSAQICSWPIIAYYFGMVSFISIIANALVLPIIPFLMLVGFITASIGFLSLWLGRLLGLVPWFMLSYILRITEMLAKLRFASIGYSFASPLFLIGYFIIILEIIYLLSKRQRRANEV